jgi:Na+/H+ antiporter NhaA
VVALLVADLAFAGDNSLAAAKLGIIGGSLLAGGLGAAVLASSLPRSHRSLPPVSGDPGSGT